MADDSVEHLCGKVQPLPVFFKVVEQPETLDVVLENAFVLFLQECRKNPFAVVPERRVAHVVAQRNRLDQVFVQVQETPDGARNLRDHLHVQHAVRDVVVLDQVKHLRLVDVAAVTVRMDDPVGVVEKFGPHVCTFCMVAVCLRGPASVRRERFFLGR